MFYYNHKSPNPNEVVFGRIVKFTENGAYCNLIEYNDIEGFVLNTELDKKVPNARRQFIYNVVYPLCVLKNTDSYNRKDERINLSYKKVGKGARKNYLKGLLR
jgi:Translation initiation factor 2, alpha subunit (eIF-2alpha)